MHRAYFTKTDLTTSYGRKVTGVYNFLNMIFSYIKKYKASDIIVCWDSPSWRKDVDEDYKASRIKKDENYIDQIRVVRAGLIALRLPDVRLEGYEADDLLAHYVKTFEGDCIIVSDDHDFEQLLSEEGRVVRIIKKGKDLYTTVDAEDKYGVSVENLPYLWAIMGDSADEIKGIPKVGVKRASKLLKEVDYDFNKVFEDPKYSQYKEECYLNLEMIKLEGFSDAPEIDTSINDFIRYNFNEDLIDTFMDDMEFSKFKLMIKDRSLV